MKYFVFDTERIKGSEIYLFAYQIYDEKGNIIESKSFQDISIDLTSRKSPRSKVKKLEHVTEKINSFDDLYEIMSIASADTFVIAFSDTDLKVIRTKCKTLGIPYKRIQMLDIQKVLYELSENEKQKSNLKGFCKSHGIKYDPHIPESDCHATFEVFKLLLSEYGSDYLESYRIWV